MKKKIFIKISGLLILAIFLFNASLVLNSSVGDIKLDIISQKALAEGEGDQEFACFWCGDNYGYGSIYVWDCMSCGWNLFDNPHCPNTCWL